MSVHNLPARRLVERDLKPGQGLLLDVDALIQAAKVYCHGAGREDCKEPGCYVSVPSTTAEISRRLLDASGILLVAKMWLEGDLAPAKAREHLARMRVSVGAWPEGPLPDALSRLRGDVDTFSERMHGVKTRLALALAQASEAA